MLLDPFQARYWVLGLVLIGSVRRSESCSAQVVSAPSGERPILGADISWTQQREADNTKYSDHGAQKDILEILREHGFNWIRLRIFVDPRAEHGYSRNKGYCDLDHTIAMAKRIKAADMNFLLDFHYSDTWADPGKQFKPSAWKDLHGEALQKAVREYTRNTLERMKVEHVLPDMIQVGNEINHGILWPDGALDRENWDSFCNLLKAATTGARMPIHPRKSCFTSHAAARIENREASSTM